MQYEADGLTQEFCYMIDRVGRVAASVPLGHAYVKVVLRGAVTYEAAVTISGTLQRVDLR